MEKEIHLNAIISSYLIRLSALLTLIGYFLFTDHNSIIIMIAILITIFLLIGSAHLIQRGNTWVRWLLLALFLLGLVADTIAIPALLKRSLFQGGFVLLQDVIQLIALVLLFVPYQQVTEVDDEEI
jgi:hypothetical protein